MMNKSVNKKPYLAVALGIILLSAAGCTSEGGVTDEEMNELLPKVETAKVQEMISSYTLNLPGEILPYEQVDLYPKVKGFVKQIYVDRGSRVRQGQLLAKLEAPEITQASLAASARKREVLENLGLSNQTYRRLEKAAENEGAVSGLELDQARARVMSDSANLESLDAEMAAAHQLAAYLEIRAPFDGVISTRNVSPGALVGTNDVPLFSLAHQDRMRLTLAIPEKHSRALKDSTIVEYKLGKYPDEAFEAMISRNSGVMDPRLRSLVVEFDLDNLDRKLHGGEYVEVKVPFQHSSPSLWVPASSLVDVSSGLFVLKVEGDSIRRIEVTKGIQKDGLVEIFGSLQSDNLVVLKGSEELREGAKFSFNK